MKCSFVLCLLTYLFGPEVDGIWPPKNAWPCPLPSFIRPLRRLKNMTNHQYTVSVCIRDQVVDDIEGQGLNHTWYLHFMKNPELLRASEFMGWYTHNLKYFRCHLKHNSLRNSSPPIKLKIFQILTILINFYRGLEKPKNPEFRIYPERYSCMLNTTTIGQQSCEV